MPMEQVKVDWINKLTGAAALRNNEQLKWDARDKALTQIRSKIADNRDRLKDAMDITVHREGMALEYNKEFEIVKKTDTSKKDEGDQQKVLDYDNLDPTKVFDWAEQYEGYNLMTDEDLVKHADAAKLVETLMMELESATVEIGGKKVPLFDKKDIADEFYTPLVREGLMAETFVPNDYSLTKKMLEGTFEKYQVRLEDEGFSDTTMGEYALLGLPYVTKAASFLSTLPVFMDLDLKASPEWSDFVPAVEDVSWLSNKDTSTLTEIADCLSKGMDALSDVVVEGGIDLQELLDKYKDPETPVKPVDRRRLMAGRIADTLVSGVSGVVSISLNSWGLGLAASSVYRSNANLKGITKLLQETTEDLVGEGDEIVGFLKNGFAKIFEVFPTTVTKAQDAKTALETSFATCSGSAVATRINSEDYVGALKLVTDAAEIAMQAALADPDLINQINAEKDDINKELGKKMTEEFKTNLENFEDQRKKDRALLEAGDSPENISRIAKMIAQIEQDRIRAKWAMTMMNQGTAFASKFFAPLVMAGSALSFAENYIKRGNRLQDGLNFLESKRDMLRAASPSSAAIQNFVINAKDQQTYYEIKACFDLASFLGALIETASYGSGPGAVIGVVVGQSMQATAGALSVMYELAYERGMRLKANEAWIKYKEALLKPENRKVGLLAMNANPTLAKYAVAWGAIVEKDPLVADFLTKTGLTLESLEDQADVGLVVQYLETRFLDDNVIVGREAAAKGWAPAPALTLECWNAAIRRGAKEANLLVNDAYEKPIQNVEYSILACGKPWEAFEALPAGTSGAKAVVDANISALQTLIRTLDYSPKRIEDGKTIEHAQMRQFLNSIIKLAKERIGEINVKYPIQTVEWEALDPIVYGTKLDNSQEKANLVIGNGNLIYLFKNNDVLNAGDHQLAVYAEATDQYQESPKVFAKFRVEKADQVVEWVEDLGEITTGTPLGVAQMSANPGVPAAGGGPLKYSFVDGEIKTDGVYQLEVYAEATANYNQSPTVFAKIKVGP